MRIAVLAALLFLAGCATKPPEPIDRTVDVDMAVTRHCDTSKLGPDPVYPATPAAMAAVPFPDAASRLAANPLDAPAVIDELSNLGYQVKLLLDDRVARIQRDSEKQAAIDGCK